MLPLAQRQLVAYQFGDALNLDTHRGTTYTASRYERLPLPYAALQEGIAPPGEAMSVAQVSATAQQWGDRVIITDVANLTIKHPLFKQATNSVAMQLPETLERNTFNTLLAATQVNYTNGRANRAALVATDVLSPHEINRIVGSLEDYGAPSFNGDEREDMMKDAGAYRKSKAAAIMPHYVGLIHPFPVQDMRENATVVLAWTHNDVDRLYNSELGEWGGVRFSDFLKLNGADLSAKYVGFKCFDEYYTSIDMPTALHAQTQLTLSYADQPLPPKYGYPMKLRMPTKLGYKNPKHISEIFVTNTHPGGYWEDQGYNWFGGS